MKDLCIRCENQVHTDPQTARTLCGCTLRTCGCYGLRNMMTLDKDKK